MQLIKLHITFKKNTFIEIKLIWHVQILSWKFTNDLATTLSRHMPTVSFNNY